jgi:hypothetical protein
MTPARFSTAALITLAALVTAKKPSSTNAPDQAPVLQIKTAIARLIPALQILVMVRLLARKELLLKHVQEPHRWMADGADGAGGVRVLYHVEQELKPEPELVIILRLIPAVPVVQDLLLKPKTAIRNPAP